MTNQFITLKDKRRLGFAEYGSATGMPVLAFFGTAARFLRPPDEVTEGLGIRLITVERPGIGLSDFQAGRTLLDWPADLLELADALALERFAVIGASQGGPYAAACAYKIPHRLTAVSLVSSLAPFNVPSIMAGMAAPLRMLPVLANRLPLLLKAMQSLTGFFVRRYPASFFKQTFRHLPPSDQQILQDYPEFEQLFLQDAPEIFRQGGKGATHDIIVVTRPVGIPSRRDPNKGLPLARRK